MGNQRWSRIITDRHFVAAYPIKYDRNSHSVHISPRSQAIGSCRRKRLKHHAGCEKTSSKWCSGKPDVVQMLTVALLAEEHILLEDVPGVGKTLAG